MPKARHMASKAQWHALMARYGNRGWVHKWAERVEQAGGPKTGYRALPARKGVKKR